MPADRKCLRCGCEWDSAVLGLLCPKQCKPVRQVDNLCDGVIGFGCVGAPPIEIRKGDDGRWLCADCRDFETRSRHGKRRRNGP